MQILEKKEGCFRTESGVNNVSETPFMKISEILNLRTLFPYGLNAVKMGEVGENNFLKNCLIEAQKLHPLVNF